MFGHHGERADTPKCVKPGQAVRRGHQGQFTGPGDQADYSHSMVPGGLLVTSRMTRLTSRTSLVIRVEIRASTS